ncbi:centromere protein P [Polyodon spathula]|uniref:centromere protein P n=1 Tax=Polyodon spathula TaxID=7913 RepID=UPI001B7F5747|nr:centromere protein P [Polyodon spathula]
MKSSSEQLYEEEIRSLKHEIKMLEEQYADMENSGTYSEEHYRSTLASLIGKSKKDSTKQQAFAALKTKLDSLEAELAQQSQMSGYVFTNYSKKTLEKSHLKALQQHRLSGRCHFLTFQIEFQLMEVQMEATVSTTVTDLNIVVESSEFTDMSAFVSRAEDTKSLLLFFRTLKSFADWCVHRKRTLLHFKEKYPSIVRLPEGCSAEYMVIQSPKLPGCELKIVWNIDVTEEGVVTPKLNLLTKIPEQALLLDKRKAVESAPHCFKNLLRLLGIEATIESVIKSLLMEE